MQVSSRRVPFIAVGGSCSLHICGLDILVPTATKLYLFLIRLGFGISPDGSLSAADPLLLRNMSSCEFDVVAMDTLYATSVHLKLVCKYFGVVNIVRTSISSL